MHVPALSLLAGSTQARKPRRPHQVPATRAERGRARGALQRPRQEAARGEATQVHLPRAVLPALRGAQAGEGEAAGGQGHAQALAGSQLESEGLRVRAGVVRCQVALAPPARMV